MSRHPYTAPSVVEAGLVLVGCATLGGGAARTTEGRNIEQGRKPPPSRAVLVAGAGVAVLAVLVLLAVRREASPNPSATPNPEPAPSADTQRGTAVALTGAQRAWLDTRAPATRAALENAAAEYREACLGTSAARSLGAQADRAIEAWVGEVRAAHAAIDAAGSDSEREHALDLSRTLAARRAPDTLPKSDSEPLRHDLYARAARLALQLGRFEDAERVATEGLYVAGHDPFRAQALIVLSEARRASDDARGEAQALELARKEVALAPK